MSDKLRELIAKWRTQTFESQSTSDFCAGARDAGQKCANMLEAALAAEPEQLPNASPPWGENQWGDGKPSKEALKMAREWIEHRNSGVCNFDFDEECLARLLDSERLKARLEEAKWWHIEVGAEAMPSCCKRIAALEQAADKKA